MTSMIAVLFLLLSAPQRTPLLNLYLEAADHAADGNLQEASSRLEEIAARMPDDPRARYNSGINSMLAGDFASADSILSSLPQGNIQGDTLLEALSSARLGNAMAQGDYAGVQSVVEMLLPRISAGEASMRMAQNWEVALKWLQQNEPPPPEDQQDQE
ncbi:MAG TPA: hypothetical protein PLM22_04650, partial [Candidatus Sabulitectum sp.]|nr:hypothetical protein [Candidatus Sabulitectum sp.]